MRYTQPIRVTETSNTHKNFFARCARAIRSHFAKEAWLVLKRFALKHLLGAFAPLVLHHSREMAICDPALHEGADVELMEAMVFLLTSQAGWCMGLPEISKRATQTFGSGRDKLARHFRANGTSAPPLVTVTVTCDCWQL